MAEMTITELRRTGAATEPTLVSFRWSGATHSSMVGPLELELAVKTVREVPAGSEEVVEQVLASSWEPFTIEGEWIDHWAGQGFAKQTMIEFSRLVKRAPLVRFTLDEQSLVGIITNLKLRYDRRTRIGWTVTFSPHRNELVGNTRQSLDRPPPLPVTQRIDDALAALESLEDAAADVEDLPTATDAIETSAASLAELEDATTRIESASQVGLGEDAERKLLHLASSFRRVRSAAMNVAFDVARKREDLTLGFQDAITILKFEGWVRTTFVDAMRAAGMARLAELDMRAKAARRPRAIHRAKQGESLERISLRYYGTADNWRAIYDANNLDSILLEGGEELLIPERAA